MHQNSVTSDSAGAITRYFAKANLPTQQETLGEIVTEILKDIKFYKMHIFKYSPRKGTKAAVMPNQIDGNIKEERSKKLIELSDEFENMYNKEYVGKEVEVLFEENHQENDEQYIKGHTTNYIVVKVKNNDDMIKENSIQFVRIIGTDKTELIGEKVWR